MAAACCAVVALWVSLPAAGAAAATHPGPSAVPAEQAATATPIKHFVYLMQESRSFDEYFGTYPGADGIPDHVCMPRDLTQLSAGCVAPSHRGGEPTLEIRNALSTQRAQIDSGRMDGFVSAVRGDPAAADSVMGYYDDRELPWYWSLADQYVLFDRFFASTAGGHVANHMYWMAGTRGTSPTQDAVPAGGWGDNIATVFDRLQAAGIPWKVYVRGYAESNRAEASVSPSSQADVALANRVPLLGMPRFRQDPALSSQIVDLSEYYSDLQQGTLPSVAFVVPSGASSEHPPADVSIGQAFVRGLVNELMRSSAWDSSAFLMSYDDSGSSYDHVPIPASSPDGTGYGLRVPALLVSPYARRGKIDHTPLDATSGLAFIRENWGIEPLAQRDGTAPSFASAFDFTSPSRPPVLVSDVRNPAVTLAAKTSALYPAYGLALLIPVVIAFGTARRTRRERHTR
jgi:phospholipase C